MQRTIRMKPRARAPLAVVALAAASIVAAATADANPRVASINLCADQHLLALADPEQILTVSWLAADPEESLLASEAQRYTLNYGTAEELLNFEPDVVLAGTYTSPFTRTMLRRLGISVVELEPEASIADIERNVRLVAELVGQVARGEQLVATMREQVRAIEANRPRRSLAAVIVRPGGFTVGAESLANELLTLAGFSNVAAERGLDRWGSLSMEALLRSAPEVIVLTGYRSTQPSLANAALDHPALARLGATQRTVTVHTALWACGLPRSIEAAALLQLAASP
ncbi:MAG TPA: ABC transporter substrate-binding protein [Gammaproteobacteria bacterium]|nr:ABC transporter substrate-binding protein [Gammaproteobacteria bacterium]